MRLQPLIAVRDVEKSSRWYQTLLGCTSGHGGREYERLMRGDDFIMQLHAWGAHEHPPLMKPDAAPVGHGVLLWFQVDDFDAALKRARALKPKFLDELLVNDSANQRETWLYDPDGYVVVLAGMAGDMGKAKR